MPTRARLLAVAAAFARAPAVALHPHGVTGSGAPLSPKLFGCTCERPGWPAPRRCLGSTGTEETAGARALEGRRW